MSTTHGLSLILVVGCVAEPSATGVNVAMIEPEMVESAPDCADIGGVPSGARPFAIAGASTDLRAYVLDDHDVFCVGLVDLDLASTVELRSVLDPRVVFDAETAAPPSDQLDQPTENQSPPQTASTTDCEICGKDPEPMDPDPTPLPETDEE